MQIIHVIDDFLFEIFPEMRGADKNKIIEVIKSFYTYKVYEPVIELKDNIIIVNINTSAIINQEADYIKVVNLCEKGRFQEARPILDRLLDVNPTNSEYHRILGQIYSEEGDNESAIDSLIDALRWNPKNGWALLLMGNILAKFKSDVPTAMKYYDQALIANPNDNIVRNNIGANLMQQGKILEAKKYFIDALNIDQSYPNTHFALSMIAEMEGDLNTAFAKAIDAIKFNTKKDTLFQNSLKQLFAISKRVQETTVGEEMYLGYRTKLENEGGRKIAIIAENDISTPAKFEIAENYNREVHKLKYKPEYPAIEHLIMHELVHLDFLIKARKENLNQLFISTQNHKKEFLKKFEMAVKKLQKKGIPEESISEYFTSMFEGLNQQIYNTPIDLFIENFLYQEFTELRPFQFISLYRLYLDAVKAVTDKRNTEFAPKEIVSKSKIYNLVMALQFRDLFGIDLISDFESLGSELKKATDFYTEFLEYRDNKEPAEEYELVVHWAEDLGLSKNFQIVNELESHSKTSVNNILESIEKDPYDIKKDPSKEKEMAQFLKSQEAIGINMAVVMYMLDALQYFESRTLQEIRKIAVEIALQGTQGYHPEKKDYRISAIKGKLFTGYHILAYYYVSFALAIPDMLSQIQLPYDEEYKLAKQMHKSGK